MKQAVWVVAIAVLCSLPVAQARQSPISDDAIAKQIIEASIAEYPGNCPCPYNAARNGSACGRRSAYTRPGGYSPKCYRKDVTAEDIAEYRQRLGPH